jgi:hypothetical protein
MNLELFSKEKEAVANQIRQRILLEDARKLLLENKTIIISGTVRYFLINDLGLGVYEIGLAAKDSYKTEMAKRAYIPTLNDDGTSMFPNI